MDGTLQQPHGAIQKTCFTSKKFLSFSNLAFEVLHRHSGFQELSPQTVFSPKSSEAGHHDIEDREPTAL
jgi:hypothetical protein